MHPEAILRLFELTAGASVAGETITLRIAPVQRGRTNILAAALVSYWRWCAEGRLPYQGRVSEGQWFYDTYHERVEFDADSKTYRFCIQLDDGPDGDTWWEGCCKVDGGGLVVTEQRQVRG